MKKATSKKLTLKNMDKLYKEALKCGLNGEALVGFIGGIPVYSNPICPPGVIYMLNDTWTKMKSQTKDEK